jgi:hypothetical protein
MLEFVTEFMAEPELFVTRARLALKHPDLRAHALVRFARVEAVVAAAAAEELRAGATDVRPQLIGAATAAAIRSTAQTYVARGGRGDPREIVDGAFNLLEEGLRT